MEEITLDSNLFGELKRNFNDMLNKLLEEMIKTDSPEASVTAKVTVVLDDVPKNGEMVKQPSFQHKITSAMQIKNSVDGEISAPMYLVKNPKGIFEMHALFGDLFAGSGFRDMEADV